MQADGAMEQVDTLGDLRAALSAAPVTAPVHLATAEGEFGGAYHLTEVRLAEVASVDCSAARDAWSEALVQVLDAPGPKPMAAGKFAGVLEKSAAALPGLDAARLQFEGTPGNRGLLRFRVATVETHGEQVILRLAVEGALCKPSVARQPAARCCGAAQACC